MITNLSGTSFKQVPNTNVWVFQHASHVSCSKAHEGMFSGTGRVQETPLTAERPVKCGKASEHHICLDPFFMDNVSLNRLWQDMKHTGSPPLYEPDLGQILTVRTIPKDLPMFSTGGGGGGGGGGGLPTAHGATFSKDVW